MKHTPTQPKTYQGEFLIIYSFRKLQNGEYAISCNLGKTTFKKGKEVSVKETIRVSYDAMKAVIAKIYPAMSDWDGEQIPLGSWFILETAVIGTIKI